MLRKPPERRQLQAMMKALLAALMKSLSVAFASQARRLASSSHLACARVRCVSSIWSAWKPGGDGPPTPNLTISVRTACIDTPFAALSMHRCGGRAGLGCNKWHAKGSVKRFCPHPHPPCPPFTDHSRASPTQRAHPFHRYSAQRSSCISSRWWPFSSS